MQTAEPNTDALLARVLTFGRKAVADNVFAQHAVAALLAIAAVGVRAALGPWFGTGAYYFLYFPVVILVAYALGWRASLTAILLIGASSYFFFSSPPGLKSDIPANLRLVLFFASASLVTYVVASLRAQLKRLGDRVRQSEDTARGHAALLQEHAARVSDHLQLVAGLLRMRLRNEPSEDDYSRALTNAAARTLLISRVHRAFAGADKTRVDFSLIAPALADAALRPEGRTFAPITVDGNVSVDPEQATSLALILLECLTTRDVADQVSVVIALSEQNGAGAMNVVEVYENGQPSWRRRDTRLLSALAEQMQAQLVLGSTGSRATMSLAFPLGAPTLPQWMEPRH